MKATDDLRHEHDTILFSLKILEVICRRAKSLQEVSPADIASLLDFYTVFADRCHHGKEEALLFPALEKAGIPRERGPIGVMLLEHDRGRELIKNMTLHMDGTERGMKRFAEYADDYISLLRGHIEKENNILFPMGDARLSENDQENLLEKFDDFEERVIGGGKHDEYHNMLTVLKNRYSVK